MDSTKLKLQTFDISDTTKRLIELSRKRIQSDLLSSEAAAETIAMEKLEKNNNDQEYKKLDTELSSATGSDKLVTETSPSADEVHKIIDSINHSDDRKSRKLSLQVRTPFSDKLIKNLEARINISGSNESLTSYMTNKDIFSKFVQFKIQKTLAKNKSFKEGNMCYQPDDEESDSDAGFGNIGELSNEDKQYSTILAGLLTNKYYDGKKANEIENGNGFENVENEKQTSELPAYRRFKQLIELKKKQAENEKMQPKEEEESGSVSSRPNEKKQKKRKNNNIDNSIEMKKAKKPQMKNTGNELNDDKKIDNDGKEMIMVKKLENSKQDGLIEKSKKNGEEINEKETVESETSTGNVHIPDKEDKSIIEHSLDESEKVGLILEQLDNKKEGKDHETKED